MKVAKYALGICIGELQAPSQILILPPFQYCKSRFLRNFPPSSFIAMSCKLATLIQARKHSKFFANQGLSLLQIHIGVYTVLQCAVPYRDDIVYGRPLIKVTMQFKCRFKNLNLEWTLLSIKYLFTRFQVNHLLLMAQILYLHQFFIVNFKYSDALTR